MKDKENSSRFFRASCPCRSLANQSKLQSTHALREFVAVDSVCGLASVRSRARARSKLGCARAAVDGEVRTVLLRLECEREGVVGLLLLFGQLPRNVIFGAETLATLLKRGEVARCHHAGALTGRARSGERAGDLGVGRIEEGGLVVGIGEGVGVGCGMQC